LGVDETLQGYPERKNKIITLTNTCILGHAFIYLESNGIVIVGGRK
jgi:hypothetical protein